MNTMRSLFIKHFMIFVVIGFLPSFSGFPVQLLRPSTSHPHGFIASDHDEIPIIQIANQTSNSSPPYYGYTTFKAPSDPDLPVEELSDYSNFLHVRHKTYYDRNAQDFFHLAPTSDGLQRLRGTNIKLILKLDRNLVEPVPQEECCSDLSIPLNECSVNVCGFNEGELMELKAIIDPFSDVIEAIYVVNEPYKPINNYSEEYLRGLVQIVKNIFPEYKMYVNFLSPYYRSLGIPGDFPQIPDNIDLIAFDAYFTPLLDQESWYKQMIGNDISIIKDRANGRPVIFSSLAYRTDNNPPEGPDSSPELYQAQWDYEIYIDQDLAGLRWFFYDEKTPVGTWYGASHWPELITKHKEIGQKMLGHSTAPAAFFPLVSSSPVPVSPGQITVIRDIQYGDSVNGVDNLLDLYLPNNPTGKIPVIIWIHGGGLSTGDKSMAGQGTELVKEGFAVVGINYRLAPDYFLPTQIYDIKAATRWVRSNAAKYNLDPDNVGVLGGSAGATLSAGLGTSGDIQQLEGSVGQNPGYSSRVQASVALAGVYDFYNFYSDKVRFCEIGKIENYNDCYLEHFFGCSLVNESCWQALELGTPISHVSEDDPPFLICIGDQDQTPGGMEDHINFHNAIQEKGVESTLTIVPGGHHGQCYESKFNEILAFFNRHLKQ